MRSITADTEPVGVESRVAWFERHEPTRRPILIVEDSSRDLIGWISFESFYGRPAYDSTAEISIYLAEKARGRGTGRNVLQHCVEIAPKFGIKTLLGYIFAHNEPSLRLFASVGFEEWANLRNVALIDGVERSLKIFGRRVV